MRDVTVGFDGEQKIGGRELAPFFKCLLLGQMIKSVVDFDGVEFLRIVAQPVALGQVSGIKRPCQWS